MQRADVQKQFQKFGVNPMEASMHVASMNDAEIQKLAGKIDSTPADADTVVISLTTAKMGAPT